MTLLAMVQEALARLAYPTVSTLTSMTDRNGTRILAHINNWNRRIVSKPELTRLRDGQISFSSVAGQMRYGLPPSIQQIQRIWETTHQTRLAERSMGWLRDDPSAAAYSGTPQFYIPFGFTAVARQPATTGLWVSSTSAADTTQKVSIVGIRAAGGIRRPSETTLTGTTRVAVGTATDYVDVTMFSVDGACAGVVTLHDAAVAGNDLAYIHIFRTFSRYFTVYLWPVPSEAITYYVEAKRQINDLLLNTDEPLIPEDFHDILIAGAVYQELLIRKDPQTAGIVFANEIKPRITELLHFVSNTEGMITIPETSRRNDVGSNLGPWFPAGRWE